MSSTGLKHAIITGFLGKTTDRFRSYNEPLTVEEKLRAIRDIDGVDGVEMVYPYEVKDPADLKPLLDRYGIGMAAVNVNVKSEDDFIHGSLSSPEKALRDKAVRFIKEAKDFAAEVGADKVQCCPLGDGYEFHFQADYGQTWKWMLETIGEAGAYRPEIPLFVEYKPSEVRGRSFIESASKTLYLLKELDNPAIGVTLDFGHSIYGDENPAESFALIAESDYPCYVHINDNDGKWDWDYMVASRHFLAYLEFLFYLKKYGYSDWLTSDTSPTRQSIKDTFEANVRWTARLWKVMERIDEAELRGLMGQTDYMKTWRFLEDLLFGKED